VDSKLSLNYWIFKVKDEENAKYRRRGIDIFQHRISECFWSFPQFTETGKPTPHIMDLKTGDSVLFYLVNPLGSKFIGNCVLDSDYTTLDEETTKKLLHTEYIDHNQGVFLKNIDRWNKPLPVDQLKGKGSFVRGSGTFASFFKGSIKKIDSRKEYEAVISEHNLTV
jgi:hypothetical protein